MIHNIVNMKKERTYEDYVRYCTEAYNRGIDSTYVLHDMLGWSHEEIRRFSDEDRFAPKKGMSTRYKAATTPTKAVTPNYNYLLIG